MSWFKGKTPEKVVDGIASGIDKAFFTNEERADVTKSMADALGQLAKDTMNESSTRAVTRRLLCISVTIVYLLLIIAAVVIYYFNIEYSAFIYKVADECLSNLVLMTFAFYVGAYMVNSYIKPKDKNK